MRNQEQRGTVLEAEKAKVKPPPLFKVMLLNDDYTPMDFVVDVLETLFQKSPAEAYRVMMQVHLEGRGRCGAYTYEVAETKVSVVHQLAQERGFPLLASIEEA